MLLAPSCVFLMQDFLNELILALWAPRARKVLLLASFPMFLLEAHLLSFPQFELKQSILHRQTTSQFIQLGCELVPTHYHQQED